jgi:hypothetical protein
MDQRLQRKNKKGLLSYSRCSYANSQAWTSAIAPVDVFDNVVLLGNQSRQCDWHVLSPSIAESPGIPVLRKRVGDRANQCIKFFLFQPSQPVAFPRPPVLEGARSGQGRRQD